MLPLDQAEAAAAVSELAAAVMAAGPAVGVHATGETGLVETKAYTARSEEAPAATPVMTRVQTPAGALEETPEAAPEETPAERRAEALLERLMLGLRTSDGVDLEQLAAEFGEATTLGGGLL
jgi:hypothetical protein